MKLTLPRPHLLLAPLLFAVVGIFFTTCSSKSTPVNFSNSWPSQSRPYLEATTAWTREGTLRAPLSDQASELLNLNATFLSTEWRSAYVNKQAELQKFSPKSKNTFIEEQKKEAAEFHEFQLVISTYYPQHNDLHREHSIWRIVLVDESGNEILAKVIEKDRRPRQLIAAEFPRLGDFSEAYKVSFPHSEKILRGKNFTLRIGSSLGTVEVKWSTL